MIRKDRGVARIYQITSCFPFSPSSTTSKIKGNHQHILHIWKPYFYFPSKNDFILYPVKKDIKLILQYLITMVFLRDKHIRVIYVLYKKTRSSKLNFKLLIINQIIVVVIFIQRMNKWFKNKRKNLFFIISWICPP